MLQQIDVVYEDSDGPQAIALPIFNLTTKDSLLLRKVTGLSPADRTLFIGDYARDGGTYQGNRVGKRNVVMTIDLNPNPALGETVDSLRTLTDTVFLDPLPDDDALQFIFHCDNAAERYLVGYTEKIDDDIFSADTLRQISIICVDPFIRDVFETTFSHPVGWASVPFSYAGSAETGFEVNITITNATPILTLANNNSTMVFTYSFEAGDQVYINTTPGSRMATVTRSGVTTSLIGALSPTSRWIQLRAAKNTLRVYGILSTNVVAVIKDLVYRSAYWGL